jgi:hypothetical protein
MIAALYLDLTEKDHYPYEKEFLIRLKAAIPEVITLDLDKNSEPMMLEYAHAMLKDASKAILYVEASQQVLPKFLAFPELMVKNPEKYVVFLNGENLPIERILSGIDKNYLTKNAAMDIAITISKSFLEAGSDS